MADFLAEVVGLLLAYWPFFGAVILGLAMPAFIIVFSQFAQRFPDHLKLAALLAMIILGSTMATALSGRILVSEAELAAHPLLVETAAGATGNFWPSRLAHLVLLSISIAEIFMWVIRRRQMPAGVMVLWAAAIAYYFFSVVVSGILGNFRSMELNVIYAPIVFTGAALLTSNDFAKTLQTLRWVLFFPLLGSLLCIGLAPSLVIETGYKGFLPGVTFRLAGFTEHANSLSVVSAIALLLEFSGYVRRRPNLLFVAVSAATLLLAQSKTSWMVFLLGAGLLLINWLRERSRTLQARNTALAVLASFFMLGSAAVAFLFLKIDAIQRFLEADKTGLVTFTGRTKIWAITWDEFLRSPLSGYGPAIWDLQYRMQHGMSYVGQAHNQIMQTLGQAGVIGVCSLIFYLIILITRSWRGWNKTHGLAFVFVAVLVIRGFSESPMRMIGMMDVDSFVHLLAFAAVATTMARCNDQRAKP